MDIAFRQEKGHPMVTRKELPLYLRWRDVLYSIKTTHKVIPASIISHKQALQHLVYYSNSDEKKSPINQSPCYLCVCRGRYKMISMDRKKIIKFVDSKNGQSYSLPIEAIFHNNDLLCQFDSHQSSYIQLIMHIKMDKQRKSARNSGKINNVVNLFSEPQMMIVA